MLRVVSLGSFVSDPRFLRRNTRGVLPYPVGYTIERGVFLGAGGNAFGEKTKVLFPGDKGADTHVADVYFTASIKEGPSGGPVFEVTRSDRPDIVHSGDNPSTPWRRALEAAEKDFAHRLEEIVRENRDAQGGRVVRGQKWFGLTFDIIVARLKTLPSACAVSHDGTGSSQGGKKSRESAAATKRAATATEKRRRGSQARSSVVSSQQSVPQTDASAPLTRRRAAKKEKSDGNGSSAAPDDDDVPLNVSFAGAVSGVCKPCPECGLRTIFCPMTGKPHEMANSQGSNGASAQGDTSGKTRRAARKTNGPQAAGETPPKCAGKKRSRSTDGVDGTDAPTAKRLKKGEEKPATRRKAIKAEKPSASTAATQNGQKRRQVQLKLPLRGSQAESMDQDDMPLAVRLAKNIVSEDAPATRGPSPIPASPSLSPPPLFRPPLAASESQKALQVLQRLIIAEEVIHAPFASLLHLPLVAAAKPRAGRKKKSEDTTGAGEPDADADAAVDEASAAAATRVEKNKPSLEAKDRHPLDIADVASSAAGKRYVKFMQLYTSERTKLELLKRADTASPVSGGRGAQGRQTETDEGRSLAPSSVTPAEGGSNEVKLETQQS